MDMEIKDNLFLSGRSISVGGTPLVFYYTDDEGCAKRRPPPSATGALSAALQSAQRQALCFDAETAGCGGRRYCGFSDVIDKNFTFFLSYGIPGQVEGERYRERPNSSRNSSTSQPFSRRGPVHRLQALDAINEYDEPEGVIFMPRRRDFRALQPANFDREDAKGVIARCRSLRYHRPVLTWKKTRRGPGGPGLVRCSARPFVGRRAEHGFR